MNTFWAVVTIVVVVAIVAAVAWAFVVGPLAVPGRRGRA
jgi:hypothetical protein